jgi:hypothetical protein
MKEETALNEVHHTTERFLFEDLQGKKLEVDFDGGEVSSDAGVLFLRPALPSFPGLCASARLAAASSSRDYVGAGPVQHDPFAGPEDRSPGPANADADRGASADLLPLAGGMGEGLGVLPRLSMMIFLGSG